MSTRTVSKVYLVKASWCRACGPALDRLKADGFDITPLDYERDAEVLERLRPLTTLPHLIIAFSDSPEPLRFAGSASEMREVLTGLGAPRVG